MFLRKDVNEANRLTRDEFRVGQADLPEAAKRFVRFIVDRDGQLSRDEFIHKGALPRK